jgi:hypothetical protein
MSPPALICVSMILLTNAQRLDVLYRHTQRALHKTLLGFRSSGYTKVNNPAITRAARHVQTVPTWIEYVAIRAAMWIRQDQPLPRQFAGNIKSANLLGANEMKRPHFPVTVSLASDRTGLHRWSARSNRHESLPLADRSASRPLPQPLSRTRARGAAVPKADQRHPHRCAFVDPRFV